MRPAAVVLAVLAASAGCTSLPGLSPEPTPSPVPAPATGPPGTGPDIGVTAEGVTDPIRLYSVHARVVRDRRSYEATRRLTFRGPDGDVRGRVVVRVRVSEGGRRFAARQVVTGERPGRYATAQPFRTFSNGTTTLLLTRFGDDPVAFAWPADEAPIYGPPRALDGTVLRTVFESVPTRVTDIERRAGALVYVVRGGPGTVPAWDATNVTVAARVTGSGFVRSLTVGYDRAAERRWRVERSVAYAGVGETTVPRPAWVDPALANATTPVDGG